jgi:hypothetical protein
MPSPSWQKERTNINVTKSFKDDMQKIVDLYRERQDRNIPTGKIVESLIHGDEYIVSLYNEIKEKSL